MQKLRQLFGERASAFRLDPGAEHGPAFPVAAVGAHGHRQQNGAHDAGAGCESRFNLDGISAVAAYIYLKIFSAQDFDNAAGPVAPHIAGSVQALARTGMCDKRIFIPAGGMHAYPYAGAVHFARNPVRKLIQGRIHDIITVVGYGDAVGNGRPLRVKPPHRVKDVPEGGFRGTAAGV